MTWENIAAIGQLLAAAGVIVSLIYLARQIRAQQNESRNRIIESLTTDFNDFMKSQVDSADLCALWLRGLHRFEDLDGPSKLRFGSHIGGSFEPRTDSMLISWKARSMLNCGAAFSVHSPISRRIPVFKAGGPREDNGTPRDSAN